MRFRHRQAEEPEEGESYYASMTDMMVGILFIFIIMLSYFALQYRQTTASMKASQASPTAAHGSGTAQGDPQMVFLADEMFMPGTTALTVKGRTTARELADMLVLRLACADPRNRPKDCVGQRVNAAAIVLRSAVDTTTPAGQSAMILSQQRAQAFYQVIVSDQPSLAGIQSPGGVPALQASSNAAIVSGGQVKGASHLIVHLYGAHDTASAQ